MPIPNFEPNTLFLYDVSIAADNMVATLEDRLTTIGTGDVALSDRLIVKRGTDSCVYVHRWNRSDPDDLHDHPWNNVSLVLTVGYWEEVEENGARVTYWRPPGSVIFRKAEDRHRVILDNANPLKPVSLFITSVERREWGFHTAEGFIVGREYRSIQQYRERRDAAE